MSSITKRRVPLLRYWTARYVLVLCLGLVMIGVVSYYSIAVYMTEKQLDVLKLLAEEISDRIVDEEGRLDLDPQLPRLLERRQELLNLKERPLFIIFDGNRKIVFGRFFPFPRDLQQHLNTLLNENQDVVEFQWHNGKIYYFVKRAVQYEGASIGWVAVLYPRENFSPDGAQFNFLLIMLGSLAVLGWATIYWLTRKLIRPIKKVADAAQQIDAGNYDFQFSEDIREKEIYDLTRSFKDMANRLRQMEMMRTELLAGVTHELKTPVASISALIQAVKDGVVTGNEAKEFLEICDKEAKRMEKMIEDLLDYNSFMVGQVKVQKNRHSLNELVREIVYQWQIVHENDEVHINVLLPEKDFLVSTDAFRVKQILDNLFNNALHAMPKSGKIEVNVREESGEIVIDVKDHGTGIPKEEQELIFMRFYRGEDKKRKVKGLGLGLTFSKNLAKALGGDLILLESSPRGSIFRFTLPLSPAE